jgi:quinol monooxygenase YgiN
MSSWIRTNNCFVSRFTIDPDRREEFLLALDFLCSNADHWYEEGCNFAFQGWGRNPNQWVAIASWKSEDYLNRMRQTPWFQDAQHRMLDCCTEPMTMEQFSGMDHDRTVFDRYPVGSSQVHMKTKSLEVQFL